MDREKKLEKLNEIAVDVEDVNFDRWADFLIDVGTKRPFCYPSISPQEFAALVLAVSAVQDWQMWFRELVVKMRSTEDMPDELKKEIDAALSELPGYLTSH